MRSKQRGARGRERYSTLVEEGGQKRKDFSEAQTREDRSVTTAMSASAILSLEHDLKASEKRGSRREEGARGREIGRAHV